MLLRRLTTTASLLLAVLFCATVALADPSCCVKANAVAKDCDKKCCVEAHKAKKLCAACQKEPSCCDKALVQGKACAHKCCVEATKTKKVCEKCNPTTPKTPKK
jgi:hypothetical protein